MRSPSPLACTVDHATVFTLNAAMVARQREPFLSTYPPSTRLDMPHYRFSSLQYDPTEDRA